MFHVMLLIERNRHQYH